MNRVSYAKVVDTNGNTILNWSDSIFSGRVKVYYEGLDDGRYRIIKITNGIFTSNKDEFVTTRNHSVFFNTINSKER